MSSVLERARRHFERQRQNLSYVEVPEWPDEDGKPTRVYYFAAQNIEEQDAVMAHYNAKDGRYSLEANVAVLIKRARDEKGRPLFLPAARLDLLNTVDAEVINRIVAEMNENTEDVDPQEAQGN